MTKISILQIKKLNIFAKEIMKKLKEKVEHYNLFIQIFTDKVMNLPEHDFRSKLKSYIRIFKCRISSKIGSLSFPSKTRHEAGIFQIFIAKLNLLSVFQICIIIIFQWIMLLKVYSWILEWFYSIPEILYNFLRTDRNRLVFVH